MNEYDLDYYHEYLLDHELHNNDMADCMLCCAANETKGKGESMNVQLTQKGLEILIVSVCDVPLSSITFNNGELIIKYDSKVASLGWLNDVANQIVAGVKSALLCSCSVSPYVNGDTLVVEFELWQD
jgi:hypothetical protein